MNRCFLMGRLTSDPELKLTTSNRKVVNFTLAVDRRSKDKQTDFIRCVAWEKTAETIHQYTHKGDKLIVSGRIQVTQYEQDGKKRSAVDVVVEEFDFAESKKQEQPKAEEQKAEAVPVLADLKDDDLPF